MARDWLRNIKASDGLAALCLFLLLREWLLPLPALTDTGNLTPFLVVTGGVLALDLLFRRRWVSILLKMAGVLWLLHADFFVTPFLDGTWLVQVYDRLVRDVPLAFQQDWADMSPVSRTLLFYLMLVVLISLLSYLVLEQRQGLWFVFLTETYLATLDTFLPYNADGGIVRSLIIGFLLLAVIHFSALEKLALPRGAFRLSLWRTLVVPAMVISLSVGVAYAGPKKAPSWPDPISYFTGKEGNGTVGYPKKVGYDNTDDTLGGPFVQDNQLVFRAVTTNMYYWRGDSKDIYTGRGWEKGRREYEAILDPSTHTWGKDLFTGVETKEVRASVTFPDKERFPVIFYPGQLRQLLRYSPENTTIVYDTKHQSIETHAGIIRMFSSREPQQPQYVPNTVLQKMDGYDLVAEVPVVTEKQLMAAGTTYPREILRTYLQLPESLPRRVKELAQRLTKDEKTPYEKVQAIEFYLRSSGNYRYETEDVPVPEPGQDFVDQFLFESHRGYCDHFSTAMAVMLRSIGIPTRWVKGFAPGTETGTDERGNKVVEVRNRDAHSWVEVYFPHYGWIPFEATASFASPLEIKYDLSGQTSTQPAAPASTQPQERDPGDGRLNELENGGAAASENGGSWKGAALALAALAVAGGAVWRSRQRLLLWWLRRKLAAYPAERFAEKYDTLLRLYERLYLPRAEGETLREYVNRLHVAGDVRQDLWYLTQLYERMLYGCKEIEQKARHLAVQMMERLSRQMKP